jgi:SNF2 family DNA or RNA helicase
MQALTLDQYFTDYGTLLGQQAAKATRPLHVPGSDPLSLPALLRQPFEAQAHVIQATVAALKRQKSVLLVAEMGTGKTILSMASVHAHAAGRPYRALVFCPGQLSQKWEREIRETIKDARVYQIEKWDQLPKLDRSKPTGPTWYVIARDRAKLGAKWRPAYTMRTTMGEGRVRCPKCGTEQVDKAGIYLDAAELAKRQMKCQKETCREPLWQLTGELRRYEPAKYIHKQMRRFFDYLIIDEAHEEKSADSAQGNAVGALAAAAKKVIALTGTLIGGYAEHVRPLLFRLSPRSLIQESLGWHDGMAFNERYGRIETKIVEREGGNDEDNRQSRGSKKSKTKYIRPGIMPTLFGRHLLGNAIFLGLGEVAENLPPLDEQVIAVDMDPELEEPYREVEQALMDTVKAMLRSGKKNLLGAMLQTLLLYPDHPFDWGQVGYWDRTPSGEKSFVSVVWPPSLDSRKVYAKEERLLDVIDFERQRGRQCWVYVQYTGEKDCLERLARLCRERGYATEVLRSSVQLARREDWIKRNGPGADVVLSHPKLVETGLDLFDKRGSYNFPTLIFYQTGYNLFTMRQASRRAWRIGQHKDCKVVYLYYGGTLQARAMALMGKKMEAAQALEGKFSAEGLASMAGEEGSAEMALAKSLADRIEEGDAARHWAKVGSSVVNAVRNVEFDDDIPAFDEGTLAMLRQAFGQPALQIAG